PTQPTAAANSRQPLLTPAEWSIAQANGTWSSLFQPGDLANRLALPLWWLTASLIGLAAWPLLWRLTPHLGDRGFGLARIIGLLAISYAAWLAASLKLVPFGRTSLVAALAVLAVGSWISLRRRRGEFAAYLQSRWPLLLASEVAFTIGFLVCLAMRLVNPDL